MIKVKTDIKNVVRKPNKVHSGIHFPPDIGKGKNINLAINNVDFNSDTLDGKRDFNGKSMANSIGMTVFQKSSDEKVKTLEIKRSSKTKFKIQSIFIRPLKLSTRSNLLQKISPDFSFTSLGLYGKIEIYKS